MLSVEPSAHTSTNNDHTCALHALQTNGVGLDAPEAAVEVLQPVVHLS